MSLRRLFAALVIALVAAPTASAQSPATTAPPALMDEMTGHWVMTGTIGKAQVTHDVDVDWVLNRQYIRIHEMSRDAAPRGETGYEAWIYLVWDAKHREYAVMWLVIGLAVLILGLFPQLHTAMTDLLGVQLPSNLLFALAIVLLLGVALHLSWELSQAEDEIRRLAEESALSDAALSRLEDRIHALETESTKDTGADPE